MEALETPLAQTMPPARSPRWDGEDHDLGSTIKLGEEVCDLATVLEQGPQLLAWLPLATAIPAFACSKNVRRLLSNLVSIRIHFGFMSSGDLREFQAPWRAGEVRNRLPKSLASGPLGVHLRFELRQTPLKRQVFNRTLLKIMPIVKWEDVNDIQLVTRDTLETVESSMRKCVYAMEGCDAATYLESPMQFRHVTRLILTLSQVRGLLAGQEAFPRIKRLKVICKDSEIREGQLASLYRAFPSMSRLHLQCVPGVLLPLCEPGFEPPPDFRVTLMEDVPGGGNGLGREANIFVASHLLSLPFSWEGAFFKQVVRLQMTELCRDLGGKAGEQLAMICRELPQLRRLGTVSLRAFAELQVVREDCNLEELVISMEMDEVEGLFRGFLAFEKDKRRSSIKRLAVHLNASHGVLKPSLADEDAICAGWFNIACKLLHPNGFVMFSASARQVLETAPVQLPWLAPLNFSLDCAQYPVDSGRVPSSTPLDRPLPFYGIDVNDRPSGTLVTGSLRPNVETEDMEPSSPTSPGGRKGGPALMGRTPSNNQIEGLSKTHSPTLQPAATPMNGRRRLSVARNGAPGSAAGLSATTGSPAAMGLPTPMGSQLSGLVVPPGTPMVPRPPNWVNMQLCDAIEALIKSQGTL